MEDGIQDFGYACNFPAINQESHVERESTMTCKKQKGTGEHG